MAGGDTGSTIASLLYTIHMSGIWKVVPWIAPVLKALPSGLPDMRGNAAKMFKTRLTNGRTHDGKDVFYHLLGYVEQK